MTDVNVPDAARNLLLQGSGANALDLWGSLLKESVATQAQFAQKIAGMKLTTYQAKRLGHSTWTHKEIVEVIQRLNAAPLQNESITTTQMSVEEILGLLAVHERSGKYRARNKESPHQDSSVLSVSALSVNDRNMVIQRILEVTLTLQELARDLQKIR